MKKIIIASILVFTFFGSSLQAESSIKRDLINQILDLENSKENAEIGFKIGIKPFIEQLESQGVQESKIIAINEVVDKYAKKFANNPRLLENISNLYAENFSENELKELLAFYKTDTGKKYITKMPEIMRKSGELGIELSKSIQADFGKEVQEILK